MIKLRTHPLSPRVIVLSKIMQWDFGQYKHILCTFIYNQNNVICKSSIQDEVLLFSSIVASLRPALNNHPQSLIALSLNSAEFDLNNHTGTVIVIVDRSIIVVRYSWVCILLKTVLTGENRYNIGVDIKLSRTRAYNYTIRYRGSCIDSQVRC